MPASITDTTPDRWCEDAELLALDPDYADLIAEIEAVFTGKGPPPRPPARPDGGEPDGYRAEDRTRAHPLPARPVATRWAPTQRSPPVAAARLRYPCSIAQFPKRGDAQSTDSRHRLFQ
ncbi:hypothetical protein [Aldersonia kunmingensis]|uniref:hypothetical protein n=1 Tax=Aldersonia kunmingensis TaxID=408066 RepID=UPI0008339EF1|nr:hypothetical protein [Aldersonia kunmingensis]